MAARTSLNDKILQLLTECEVKSEEFAYTVKEIAGEFEVSEKATFDALGVLEDAGKVNGSGRGLTSMWWLSEGKKEEAPKPKRTRRTKAQMEEARRIEREKLEYATRVAESQEPGAQHVHPMEDARPVVLSDADKQRKEGVQRIMSKVKPEFKAENPVIAENGETVTVPVDWDDPSKGRRELDMAKGERLLSETTFMPRSPLEALREDAPRTAVAVEALRDKLISAAELMVSTAPAFTVEIHEPKNGEALDVPIPPLPAGVNANTWELAHQGNTEGARRYHMRQAKAQETAHAEHIEAMAESRKAVENDTPPF